MSPALQDGQLVAFSSLKKPQHENVVLSSKGEIDIVKRLHDLDGSYSLRGDNFKDSYDLEDIDIKTIHASLIYPHK